MKLNISHYYHKFLEKSRSFLAYLSTSRRIDFPLFLVSLRGRLMKLSMSSGYQRFVARLTAGAKSLSARPSAGIMSFLGYLSAVGDEFKANLSTIRRYSPVKRGQLPIRRRRLPTGEKQLPVRRKPLPSGEKPPLARSPIGRRVDAFLMVATLLVLVLVGTGYLRRATADTPAPVTVFVSPQFWAMFGDIASSFIREFEGQNHGVRIMMAGDENLDVVFFDDSNFAALVEASALASLSPYIYTETEEDQWALPLVSFVDLFFYNVDILQAAGNDRPPGTRAEFLAAARSVAETAAANQEEIFPFALGLSEMDPLGIRRDFYPWVWAMGGEIHSGFTADGALALTGPTTNTINFLAEMDREGLLAPGSFEKTGRERMGQFAEGKIAMLLASARYIPYVRDGAHGVNFDITAVPVTAPGRNRLGISGIYAGISSASTQTDRAWAFLVFIAGRSHLLASATSAIPGSFFVTFPSRYIEENPMYLKAWDIFEAADIVEFQSDNPLEKDISLIIREMLVQAFEAAE